MVLFNFSLIELQTFFLVFLRVASILLTLPVLNSRNIPALFKIGLSISIAVLLLPVLEIRKIPLSGGSLLFGIGAVSEFFLGALIGLSVRMIFEGIQLAGQTLGFQMGFTIANVLDPVTSSQVSVVGQLQNLFAILIFFTLDGHHFFLAAVVESFRIVPLFGFHVSASVIDQLIRISGNMFLISIKVAAPIMAALLLSTVALGLVSRTVPQMNVFIVAMPMKILIGLLFLGASLPYTVACLKYLFGGLAGQILPLLKAGA